MKKHAKKSSHLQVVTRPRFERGTPSFGDLRAKSEKAQRKWVVAGSFRMAWRRLKWATVGHKWVSWREPRSVSS
jgi:hypothetical protein